MVLLWHAIRKAKDKKSRATTPGSEFAKLIRHKATRLRRNRASRERNQAMRDLGMKRTSYGWE